MKDCIERNIKDVYPKKIALNEKIMIEYCYRMAGINRIILLNFHILKNNQVGDVRSSFILLRYVKFHVYVTLKVRKSLTKTSLRY